MVKSRQAASMLVMTRLFRDMRNQVKKGGCLADELRKMEIKYEVDDGAKEGSAKVLLTPNDAERIAKTDEMNANLLKHFELHGDKDGEDKALKMASDLAIAGAVGEMGGLAYGLGYNLWKFGPAVTAKKIWDRMLWADEENLKQEDQLLKASVEEVSQKARKLKNVITLGNQAESA